MKKNLLSFVVLMMGMFLIVSCDDNDSPMRVPVVISDGAYVICGGNMGSGINSSVTYIDYVTGTASQGQFIAKNGRNLGLTANDAIVYGDKMYIAVSNENTIEVVNARTLASIRQIKTTDLLGTEKGVGPRHLTAYNGMIYFSTYGSSTADFTSYPYDSNGNGYVAAIDTVSFALNATYTAGSYPEGVAIANGYLYVANSDYSVGKSPSISVIELSTGTGTQITNPSIVNPTEIAVAGNDIYVLDMGNYSTVQAGVRRISGVNSDVTTLFDCTHVSFSGYNIYACNSVYGTIPTKFFVYNISTETKTEYSTGLSGRFFSPNVIAADPVTGKIYIASYNENPSRPGYAGYSVNGYVAEYAADGTLLKTYDCGVGPNAIVFNAYVKFE